MPPAGSRRRNVEDLRHVGPEVPLHSGAHPRAGPWKPPSHRRRGATILRKESLTLPPISIRHPQKAYDLYQLIRETAILNSPWAHPRRVSRWRILLANRGMVGTHAGVSQSGVGPLNPGVLGDDAPSPSTQEPGKSRFDGLSSASPPELVDGVQFARCFA